MSRSHNESQRSDIVSFRMEGPKRRLSRRVGELGCMKCSLIAITANGSKRVLGDSWAIGDARERRVVPESMVGLMHSLLEMS